jgi:hypothetical protein
MKRYKEKYAGSPAPRSQGPARPAQTGKPGKAQKQPAAVPKAPAKKPGLLDRIKRIFGAGKDAD